MRLTAIPLDEKINTREQLKTHTTEMKIKLTLVEERKWPNHIFNLMVGSS